MKLKEYFAQLKVDLAPMTFTEKIDHIWTYNKELILIVLGFGIVVISLLVAFLTKPDVAFCGFLVNTELNDKGKTYITTDYGNVIGVTGKEEVQLLTGVYNPNYTTIAENNQATSAQLMAYCQEADLDYLLLDKVAFETLLSDDLCYDLRKFFSAEELAQWEGKLLTFTLEDGTEVAYGLDISDTKFAKDCVSNQKELYLCFISNTQRLDRCHQFLEYILNWK